MKLIRTLLVTGFIATNIMSTAHADAQSDRTLEIAQSFLNAAGSGDGKTLNTLMSDSFVWHNEGDSRIPWIGNWEGKEKVMGSFMPAFGKGLKVTSWSTDYSFSNADQAVFMGSMSAIANNTGNDTGKFTWAVRVHVENDKVQSWNWMEDSFAVSKAYNSAPESNEEIVQSFYDLLSNPASATAAKKFSDNVSDNWKSVGNYSGKDKTKDAFLGQMGFFAKLIPDLNWKVVEMIVEDDRVVVRSRATGTPTGPFFGVDGKGQNFEILTIDIHTIENGKIVKTYHVEDWAGALNQLKGK